MLEGLVMPMLMLVAYDDPTNDSQSLIDGRMGSAPIRVIPLSQATTLVYLPQRGQVAGIVARLLALMDHLPGLTIEITADPKEIPELEW
mgnify:CR=1 FL=1